MTDSPPPIDSSFDASDVATPCTVIAAKSSLRHQVETEENQENLDSFEDFTEKDENESDIVRNGDDDVSNIYVDDFSNEFGDCASSVMEPLSKPHTFSKTITKVYFYLDDQETPYMVEVHVPPDCITLRDVKRKLMRTNFKYYCIALDPDTGLEVKAEVRDDSRRLYPLKNGRFELYLLTVEGSVHSDTSSHRHRSKHHGSSKGRSGSRDYKKAAEHFDNSTFFSDNDSQASSLPTYVKKAYAYNKRHAPHPHERHLPHTILHGRHHNKNQYEDSTFEDTTESDYHYRDGVTYYDEEDDDSRSINTDLTSVSQQHIKKKWRQQQKEMRNKWKRMASLSTNSSSISSVTESSMGLEVITVRLNLEMMSLGMTPSGHTNARGDAGLYVGDVHDRGAVALDGRIDVGDMIVGINEISLDNYSNEEAVRLLKEAVQRKFVTLTVAKTGESKRSATAPFPRNPRTEPIRPIDTNEWLKHATNAIKAMPSISEESAATPIPDEWPTNSSASGTPFGGSPPSLHCMNIHTDKKIIVEVMATPGSGLERRDREWLKLIIPMSFIGSDLVDWLLDHIQGLEKRKDALKFASDMLEKSYIEQLSEKRKFSEKGYYVIGKEFAGVDYTQLRAPGSGFKYPPSQTSSASSHSGNNNIFPTSMYPLQAPPLSAAAVVNGNHRNSAILQSMVSGYASMPASPFPNGKVSSAGDCGRAKEDQRSQTSESSKGSSKRYVELPRKPASQGSGSGLSDHMNLDRVASRNSFRAAMSGSLRQFNIDN